MEILKPFPAKQYWWNGGKLASNQESGWADDSRLDQVTSAAGYKGRSLKNSETQREQGMEDSLLDRPLAAYLLWWILKLCF